MSVDVEALTRLAADAITAQHKFCSEPSPAALIASRLAREAYEDATRPLTVLALLGRLKAAEARALDADALQDAVLHAMETGGQACHSSAWIEFIGQHCVIRDAGKRVTRGEQPRVLRDEPTARDAISEHLTEFWLNGDWKRDSAAGFICESLGLPADTPVGRVARALTALEAIEGAEVGDDDVVTIVTLPNGYRCLSAVALLTHLRDFLGEPG